MPEGIGRSDVNWRTARPSAGPCGCVWLAGSSTQSSHRELSHVILGFILQPILRSLLSLSVLWLPSSGKRASRLPDSANLLCAGALHAA